MDMNFVLIIQALLNDQERQHNRIARKQLRDHSDPLTLPEGLFRNIYRLSRDTAYYLLQEVSPFFEQKVREDIAIPDTLIVLSALHFYGQGSYQKSVGQDMNMPMCQASVSKSIEVVTNVLNAHFGHLIKFPTTEDEKDAQKVKFMEMPNGFPGIIGAIDCTHIKIHPPKTDDLQYPGILFYNRKGYHSINTQCVVGADLKLLSLNARYPGSVHDSAIWATSQIREHLLQNYENGYGNSWLIGDGGYPLEPWLMTPITGQNLNRQEQRFNIAHRSNRNVVERFNGVMKAIFRCCFAERTLHYTPEKAGKIINACGILYNIRIGRQDFEEEIVNDNIVVNDDHGVNPHWRNEGRMVRQRIVHNYF